MTDFSIIFLYDNIIILSRGNDSDKQYDWELIWNEKKVLIRKKYRL